jgi:hypothetical protein
LQRDANATYGIARGHSPTAYQLRKQMHTKSSLHVAGAIPNVFTDRQLEIDSTALTQPISYKHRMFYVPLDEILFSQIDIQIGDSKKKKRKPADEDASKQRVQWKKPKTRNKM